MHTVSLPLVFTGYWYRSDSLLGVQMYASHSEQEAVMAAERAGVRWARIDFFWSQIEPENTTPENYQWPAPLDDWLARLSAQEIRVILTFTGNPSWAADYPGGPLREGVDVEELVEFVTAAVARYGAPPYNVKHWEFYNEPDNGSVFYANLGWGYWGNEPAAYAELLRAVYDPIKAVDPEAQIVLGGLSYDSSEPDGPFVQGFLDGLLENAVGPDGRVCFDVMNFHYYPVFHGRWDPYGPGIIGKTAFLRNKLAEHDIYRPFICTETGSWSDAENGGSLELQSRYVPQVFARSMAADLDVAIWFQFVDDSRLGYRKYGLLDADLVPKPAYAAYRTASRQLASADYVGPLSSSETGSAEIEAYQFLSATGPTWIIVAWTNDNLNHAMALQIDCLVRVDKSGNQTQVCDRDEGRVDGLVQVLIGPDPVYLRLDASTGEKPFDRIAIP